MAAYYQVQKIHIAKKQTGITDEEYRSMIRGYGKEKSVDLTYAEAEELLNLFITKFGWKPKRTNGSNSQRKAKKFINIEVPDDRPGEFATPSQLGMIAGLWVEKSEQGDKRSLQKFLKKITGIDMIQSLQKKDVQKVVKAINSLKKKESTNES